MGMGGLIPDYVLRELKRLEDRCNTLSRCVTYLAIALAGTLLLALLK